MILAAWYHLIFATVFSMVCIMLMLVILLQRGKGVGLSGAFGGAGGHTALGSKTGDVLTWVTMVGIAVFLLLSIVLHFAFESPKAATGKSAPPARTAPAAPAATQPVAPRATPQPVTPPPPTTQPVQTPKSETAGDAKAAQPNKPATDQPPAPDRSPAEGDKPPPATQPMPENR